MGTHPAEICLVSAGSIPCHILNQAISARTENLWKRKPCGGLMATLPQSIGWMLSCQSERWLCGWTQNYKGPISPDVCNNCFEIRLQTKQQTFEMTRKNVVPLQEDGLGSEQLVLTL